MLEPRARHPLAQRLALDELGDDEVRAVDFADLVNGEDVRMVERRGRPRLLLEAAHAVRVCGEAAGSSLSATLRLEPRVLGQVDFPHPAQAEQ